MSRFFASEDEYLSSEDDFYESYEDGLFQDDFSSVSSSSATHPGSDDESVGAVHEQPVTAATGKKSGFFDVSESESEGESVERAIVSYSDKHASECEELIVQIIALLESASWNGAFSEFDHLLRKVDRHISLGIPSDLVTLISLVEGKISGMTPEQRKALEALDFRAVNSFKQRLRKISGLYAEFKAPSAENSLLLVKQSHLRPDTHAQEKVSAEPASFTSANFLQSLQHLIASKGRRRGDKSEFIQLLEGCLGVSSSDEHSINVLLVLIPCYFEVGEDAVINASKFSTIHAKMQQLLSHLKGCPKASDLSESLGLPDSNSWLNSSFSFLQRLDDLFIATLRTIDFHSNEYVVYLRLEKPLLRLFSEFLGIFDKESQIMNFCHLKLRIIDHLYYKRADVMKKCLSELPGVDVYGLVAFVGSHGDVSMKMRALSYLIYLRAVDGSFSEAQHLLEKSNICDSVAESDVYTQVIYNRALAQYGMCAFRAGKFRDSYFALQDLCASGRPKELLAQGPAHSRLHDKHADSDRYLKKHFLPHHMHLNIELIDCVFLLSALFVESPHMVASSRFLVADKKIFNCRHLKRLIDNHDRGVFEGKPENSREMIVLAAKYLTDGKCMQAKSIVSEMKIWKHFASASDLLSLIQRKFDETGLILFFLSTAVFYTSIDIPLLSEAFSHDPAKTRLVVARLFDCIRLPYHLDDTGSTFNWKMEVDSGASGTLIRQLLEKNTQLRERVLTKA